MSVVFMSFYDILPSPAKFAVAGNVPVLLSFPQAPVQCDRQHRAPGLAALGTRELLPSPSLQCLSRELWGGEQSPRLPQDLLGHIQGSVHISVNIQGFFLSTAQIKQSYS